MLARNILVPTDFSAAGNAALEYAALLAKQGNRRLLLAHVQEPPVAYSDGAAYFATPLPTSAELLARLREIKPSDPSIAVEHRLLTGDPAQAIVKLADEEAIDLIVLSSHGRTGLARMLLGSVAETILRKAHCPVLVCKPSVRELAADRT
jgi:nucleotide-binding universal stress UspA family protein